MDILSAEKIKRRRRRKRLTQEAVAKQVGFSLRTYRRWESGEIPKNPKKADVDALVKALDCQVEDLMPTELKSLIDTIQSDVDDFMHEADFHIAKRGTALVLQRCVSILIAYQRFTQKGKFGAEDAELTEQEKDHSARMDAQMRIMLGATMDIDGNITDPFDERWGRMTTKPVEVEPK